MKALSLWQPWASLVALRVKTIETRSWSTSYRGPLAIHAAKHVPWKKRADEGERASAMTDEIPRPLWEAMKANVDEYPLLWSERCPRGVVVATCQLVDVVEMFERASDTGLIPPDRALILTPTDEGGLRWTEPLSHAAHGWNIHCCEDQRPYGDFAPGRYAWILDEIVALDPPVEASGRQGLWEWGS